MRARIRHETGRMNKTEQAYASHLEQLKRSGLIQWWAFEPVSIRLADRTFYRPDFAVVGVDGSLEFHEVKARWGDGKAGWEDDARVKIKVAAETFPAFFLAAWPGRSGKWETEGF